MIEVFKTNVKDPDHARKLVDRIHAVFPYVEANFDLEDCDKILRVKSSENYIDPTRFTTLLGNHGFQAEVLVDDFELDAKSGMFSVENYR